MSRHTPHRSRAFFVTSTIALSVAFFAVAIGTWLISQGRLDSSADTIGSCTPASQATDIFNTEARVDGGPIAAPSGWTADSGTTLVGLDRNQARHDTGDAWLALKGRISRPVRESRTGQMSFRLTARELLTNSPIDVSLLTKSGLPISLRIIADTRDSINSGSNVGGTLSEVMYLDPITRDYRDAGITLIQEVNRENTSTGEMVFTISWNGTTFTVTGFGGTTQPIRYVQNEPTSVTGVVFSNPDGTHQTLLVKELGYPGGSAVPCVTGVSPASGVVGSTATITGSQLDDSLPGQPITLVLNGVSYQAMNNTSSDSSITFTVPQVPVGTYTLGVANAYGTSQQTTSFTVTAPTVDPTPTAAAPTVASVTPTSGSTLGGTVVGVGGSNFVSGATVTVGGLPATVSAVIAGSLTITTSAHAPGAVDVIVTNPDGQTATLPNAFTYTDLTGFTLTGIAPSQGVPGQEVTITGTMLANTGNTVLFTSSTGTETKIENVTATNGALIFAVPINAALGAYTVKVSNSNGTSANTQNFTVVSAVPAPNAETPTLSGIAPAAGAAGSTVILSGTNFVATGNTVILTNAGGTATNVENVSAINRSNTLVSFTVPANTALGAYSVRLKNSKGTSVTPQTFTVIAPTTPLSTTPTLTGIAPASGAAGSDVALTGTNFTSTSNTVVLTSSVGKETKVENIGSQPNSTTALVFMVPSSTAVGAYTVKVSNSSGTSSQQVTFTVTSGVASSTDRTPILTGIAPNQGAAGSLVMLAGTNFTAAGNQILLTNSAGSTTTVDNVRLVNGASTFLTFAIPSNAAVGLYSVRVKNDNGTSVTPQAYTVVAAASTASTQGGGTSVASTAAATAPASLVSTGGSLPVNLGIALLLSIATGYFLLRRRHPGRPQ